MYVGYKTFAFNKNFCERIWFLSIIFPYYISKAEYCLFRRKFFHSSTNFRCQISNSHFNISLEDVDSALFQVSMCHCFYQE